MTNPNPTPMDIIMERGLSGKTAFSELLREDTKTGLTPEEFALLRQSPGANVDYFATLDTIIGARCHGDVTAEVIMNPPPPVPKGPDLEAAKVTAESLVKAELDCNLARSYLQVLKELEDLRELHRPRHTENGEWPEDDYLLWDDGWVPMDYDEGVPGTWLPAPPKPEVR